MAQRSNPEAPMLEILLLFFLCKKIGAIVAAKGHTKTGYQVMLVAFWIIGEISGAVLAVVVLDFGEDNPLALLGPALLGAGCGAGIAFLIANSLSDVRVQRDYDRDDDFDRRRWDDDRDDRRRQPVDDDRYSDRPG